MPCLCTCLYLVLIVPHARLVLVAPPALVSCLLYPLHLSHARCTLHTRLVLVHPPTLVRTPMLPSHPLTLVCLSLCLFGPPTLPLYLAAIVIATAAPAATAIAAAATPAVVIVIVTAAATPAASCRCCCSAVTIAIATVVAAVVAAADAAARTHSLSLVLWLVCAHPLFYLWCLSTTIYL